jgi:glycosyltransferase involved in cell wall biosynthesis
MNVFFSVVIPTYNRAGLIRATLDSFIAQEFTSFEILVVDDGGNDNTREVVEAMGDQRIQYYYKQNGERGAARNYGAARATGNYITYFDSDDIVYPYYLSHAYENISRLNNPECYAQAFEIIDTAPEPVPVKPAGIASLRTINKQLQIENILACNGVFVRRDRLSDFGFSEDRDLSGSEDWVLWLQLAGAYPFHYSPVICSCLINHEQRGELNPNRLKMEKRIQLLIHTILNDTRIKAHPTSSYNQIVSSTYAFASLKYADFSKFKLKSIGYMLRAIMIKPSTLLKRNTYVTAKKLLFTWYS